MKAKNDPTYQAWQKMPARNANERMQKTGQGFAKLATLYNPNSTHGSKQFFS